MEKIEIILDESSPKMYNQYTQALNRIKRLSLSYLAHTIFKKFKYLKIISVSEIYHSQRKLNIKEKAQQHEDIALELTVQFFAQELMSYFGIKGKVISSTLTEFVQIELRRKSRDYDFVMKDGSWKHL